MRLLPGILALLVLARLSTALATDSAPGGAAPRFAPASLEHDFGRVIPRERLRHTLNVTNLGGTALRLSHFERSCSCVEPAVRELVIAPGGVGRLEVGVQAGDPSGAFVETLAFETNDPDRPAGKLTFRGVVFRRIEAVPDFVVLPITPDSPLSQSVTVRIVNHGSTPVGLGEPRGSNPAFAAVLRPRVPGREYDLEFRATRPLPNGNHYGRFSLTTDDPEVREIVATVFVPGLAAVVITPPVLELPLAGVPPPATNAPVVLVRSTSDHRLEVTDPVTDLPGARVRMEVREPGRLVAVHLHLPANFTPARGFRSEVTVKTNHPRFPVLRIPVVARP